jgi:catecholate siderophore receptor
VQVGGARMGIAGKVSTKWQWFGGYTRLNASIVDAIAPQTAGKTPANTPKDSLSLWSTYNLTQQWEVGGGTTYTSSRYMNNTNLTQVPSYARWDAVVAYHQPKYDVRFNMFNLANKYYYDALIPSDGGRAVPGLGRSASLSVAYRF